MVALFFVLLLVLLALLLGFVMSLRLALVTTGVPSPILAGVTALFLGRVMATMACSADNTA